MTPNSPPICPRVFLFLLGRPAGAQSCPGGTQGSILVPFGEVWDSFFVVFVSFLNVFLEGLLLGILLNLLLNILLYSRLAAFKARWRGCRRHLDTYIYIYIYILNRIYYMFYNVLHAIRNGL